MGEDISTVADFVRTLDAEIEDLLGPISSCIVESSAIQYAASNSVCTRRFSAAKLAVALFCYSFRTTISPPTSGEDCEVNVAAETVAVALIDDSVAALIDGECTGGFICPVIDIAVQFAPTNAPITEGPTRETDEPTSATEEPTSGTTTEG